jgi:hypothetical protein
MKLLRVVLAMLLAAATFNANAELQIWRFNKLAHFRGTVAGIFVSDTSHARITDWDIHVQSIDPLWGSFPVIGNYSSVDKHFQPSLSIMDCGGFLCNSATFVSPTQLRFTTGTGPLTLSSLDIVLDQPLPLSGGFVPVVDGSFTFFAGAVSRIVPGFPGFPGFVFSTAVPEPQTVLVLVMGLIGLLAKYSKQVAARFRV